MDNIYHHRITQREKEANDFAWYKYQIDNLDRGTFNSASGFGGIPEKRRMQGNYDLFNNIIDPVEFNYICKPYGDTVGELPATFTNRDITSGKIKVLLGMEMKRPFSWKVVAVNEEATTRKEQEEFGRIKEYVISEVMKPIITAIRKQHAEQQQGQLSSDDIRNLEQQIEEEIKAATPDEVRRYMKREHQDPAESLAHQLLQYLSLKLNLKDVFNDGWKHGLLAGIEIFHIVDNNDTLDITPINPLNFEYDKSPDLKFIEDGEWAMAEYFMSPSKIVEMFSNDLTDKEIDRIYELCRNPLAAPEQMASPVFQFDGKEMDSNVLRVVHVNFKSLKKIGFLTYIDQQTGTKQEMIVDENYVMNRMAGDINIDWQWLPESHEGYKIGPDIYKRMRPLRGQHTDLNDLYRCKLDYIGACYDNLNSEITSLMDRMKAYQYYFNIILYRIEMLMASDKGKILLMNLNMIPQSKGIGISKFFYYMDASKTGFLNPNEEGNRNGSQDIVNAAKEIDMSLASDIEKYVKLAEYIERRCGDSVGITKTMEGQTGADESVRNNQLNYTQSSYIIEPYFNLHNQIKRNVLQAMIDKAKAVYANENSKKLTYVVDDMSIEILNIDTNLLLNSTLGIFVTDSSSAWEAKQAVQQLSQFAIQNQKSELSDVVKIIRSESIQEAEELLAAAEERANERAMALENAKAKAIEQQEEKTRQFEREKWNHEKELAILKEEERRKTVIQQQAILSIGFNEDKDIDSDGNLDVLEIANQGIDAEINIRKQKLEENKFIHQIEQDKIVNNQNDRKLKIEAQKVVSKKNTKK